MYFRIPVVEDNFSLTHNVSSTPSSPPADLTLNDILELETSPKAPSFSPITNVYCHLLSYHIAQKFDSRKVQ